MKMDWSEANDLCKATKLISTLASIPDDTTNDFLTTLTTEKAWIGGYRKSDGSWGVWTDGSTWGYTNWRSGQPNNKEGNQNYVVLNYKETGKWNDEESDGRRYVLCQYSLGSLNHFIGQLYSLII